MSLPTLRAFWRNQSGTNTLMETIAGFVVLGIMVPAIMGMIALSSRSEAEARGTIESVNASWSELDWVQSICRDHLDQVIDSTGYSVQEPRSCTNYPNGNPLALGEPDMPTLTLLVTVAPLPGEEANYDLALYTARSIWTRASKPRSTGSQMFQGYSFGSNKRYWETYDEWQNQ